MKELVAQIKEQIAAFAAEDKFLHYDSIKQAFEV